MSSFRELVTLIIDELHWVREVVKDLTIDEMEKLLKNSEQTARIRRFCNCCGKEKKLSEIAVKNRKLLRKCRKCNIYAKSVRNEEYDKLEVEAELCILKNLETTNNIHAQQVAELINSFVLESQAEYTKEQFIYKITKMLKKNISTPEFIEIKFDSDFNDESLKNFIVDYFYLASIDIYHKDINIYRSKDKNCVTITNKKVIRYLSDNVKFFARFENFLTCKSAINDLKFFGRKSSNKDILLIKNSSQMDINTNRPESDENMSNKNNKINQQTSVYIVSPSEIFNALTEEEKMAFFESERKKDDLEEERKRNSAKPLNIKIIIPDKFGFSEDVKDILKEFGHDITEGFVTETFDRLYLMYYEMEDREEFLKIIHFAYAKLCKLFPKLSQKDKIYMLKYVQDEKLLIERDKN